MVLNSILKLFCCFYVFWKEKLIELNANKSIIWIITFTLAIISFALTPFFFIPFVIFKLFVCVYLKLVHGKLFYKFIDGNSVPFQMFSEQWNIFSIFIIETDDINEFYARFKQIIIKSHETNHSLNCKAYKIFGYSYLLKNQVKSCEIYSKVVLNKVSIARDDLFEHIEDASNFNQTLMWEVKVFTEPFEENARRYAIVIKIDHTVADAMSFLAFCKRSIFDTTNNNSRVPKVITIEKRRLNDLYLYKDCYKEKFETFEGADRELHAGFFEEHPEYIEKIKLIRKKFNVSFTELFAFSLIFSVFKLMKKKKIQCKNKVLMTMSARGEIDDIQKILTNTYNTLELSNRASGSMFLMEPYNESKRPSAYLKEFHCHYQRVVNSFDVTFLYYMMKYVGAMLPTSISERLIKSQFLTPFLMLTNVSRLEKCSILNSPIVGGFSSANLLFGTGIFLTALTYDDKLLLTLNSRLEFIKNRSELQTVLEDVLKSIDLLLLEIYD